MIVGGVAQIDNHLGGIVVGAAGLGQERPDVLPHPMTLRHDVAVAHWRHLIIRSLIGMFGFDGDYEALAKMVHPHVTADEAKKSVKLLEDCELIKKGDDGKYVLTESAISTGDRTSKLALRGFHQHCLKLAADSIDRDPPGSRHVSGLTLGISQEGYERIVERINAFRKEIALIAEEDKNSDKVFQLQFALFPVGGK